MQRTRRKRKGFSVLSLFSVFSVFFADDFNNLICIYSCLHDLESKQISKKFGLTGFLLVNGVIKYAESEYVIFKCLICICMLFTCCKT